MERIAVELWLDRTDYKRWEKAAQAAGQTLDDWFCDVVVRFIESTGELDEGSLMSL